jgi:hypothetical protein
MQCLKLNESITIDLFNLHVKKIITITSKVVVNDINNRYYAVHVLICY